MLGHKRIYKMKGNIKIRQATIQDAKDIKSAHYHAYQVNYRGYAPDDFLNSLVFDDAAIQRMADHIKENEYYVAEKEGCVIGFVNLRYPQKHVVEIGGLYVHPDFQKLGVGSALMKKVCHMKKKLGYTKLILWTIKDGPSLGFYAKQGLKPSRVPEKKAGPFIAVRLEKSLVLDTPSPCPTHGTKTLHSRD